MSQKKFISKKDSKCLDVSFNLNYYDRFRLKIYNNPQNVNDILSGALFLYGSGCSVNIKEDIEWLNKNNPTLIQSLPFLDLYTKWDQGLLKNPSKDVNYFLDQLEENLKKNNPNLIDFNKELVEMSREEYGVLGKSLQKVEFLDMLFVPSSKTPRLFFYKFFKKHIIKKIQNTTNIGNSTIDDLINVIEKGKGFYKNSNQISSTNRDDLRNQKKLDRQKIAHWFRNGGKYDLF